MRLVLATLCGALLFSSSGAAWAQSANSADVRCTMIAMAIANSTDPKVKAGATMAVFYYIGRLDGRSPSLDLATAIRNEAKTMSKEQAIKESQRCNAQIVARGKALESMHLTIKPATPATAPAAAPAKAPGT